MISTRVSIFHHFPQFVAPKKSLPQRYRNELYQRNTFVAIILRSIHNRTSPPPPLVSCGIGAAVETPPDSPVHGINSIPEQYLILLTCRDEHQQVDLLNRFTAEGLDCRALVS
jgi:hypothetical protein